jgi:uncharacterized protein YggE
MNVPRRYPARFVLASAAAAAVLVIGAVAAFAQGGTASDASSGGGASGSTGSTGFAVSGTEVVGKPDLAVSSGIVAPSWCCGTTSDVPGLTTVGQSTIDGRDAAARDAAIASAVQDATAQATAAADAAGIALGAIIDMKVSAMPYSYAMPMVGAVSGSAGSSPGSPGGGNGMEPAPLRPYFGSVSVTITWSLG